MGWKVPNRTQTGRSAGSPGLSGAVLIVPDGGGGGGGDDDDDDGEVGGDGDGECEGLAGVEAEDVMTS
jgi:hypothetical protein